MRRRLDLAASLITRPAVLFLDEAEALADRIAVLRGGRIIADGTAAELTALVGTERLDDAFLALTESPLTPGETAA